MKIKPGVDISNASPELVIGMRIVEDCFQMHDLESTITSLNRKGSWERALLHGILRPLGVRSARAGKVDACDFRYPPPEKAQQVLEAIMQRLSKKFGGQFDVLDERTSAGATAAGVGDQWTGSHIHIEFDP